MKWIKLISFAFIVLTVLTSCEKVRGKGEVIEETRTVNSFTRLVMAVGGKTYYTQGNDFSVRIKAQRNILDVIQTQVENGQLKVKFKNVNVGSHEEIQVFITAPNLSRLEVSGSGDFIVDEPITVDDLELLIAGSGRINISELEANRLNTRTSGSGDMAILDGNADNTTVEISGSGNTNLLNFNSKEADVSISGSGNVQLSVSERLDARISGSGNISYKGSPQVNSQVTGSGKIKNY